MMLTSHNPARISSSHLRMSARSNGE